MLMVFGSLCHYFTFVRGRVQVEQTPGGVIELLVGLAGEDGSKKGWIGGAEMSCCGLIEGGVVEDESEPKLVIVANQGVVHFLIESVI
jgi:hypothetical protein